MFFVRKRHGLKLVSKTFYLLYLEELKTHNADRLVEVGAEPLAEALMNALQLSHRDRLQLGQNGRKLIEDNYSIGSVVRKCSIYMGGF